MKDNNLNKKQLKDKMMLFLKQCIGDKNISNKTYLKILGYVVDILHLIDKEYLEKENKNEKN